MWPDSKYLLAAATGLPALCGWSNRRRPVILTYHGLYDGPRGCRWIPETFVHVDDFAAQIEFLARRYRILDPEEFLDHLRRSAPFTNNSLLVTFDDGYESFHRLGRPILERRGIKVIVFVPTEYLSGREPFWYDMASLSWNWGSQQARDRVLSGLGGGAEGISSASRSSELLRVLKRLSPDARRASVAIMSDILREAPGEIQSVVRQCYPLTSVHLREASRAGHRAGGHTHTHTILSVLKAREAEAEIVENRRRLEECVGMPCPYFAYPNGGVGDFGDEHKEMLRRAGYEVAFSLTQDRLNPLIDPFEVSRFNVVPEDTLRSLAVRLSGVRAWIRAGKMVAKTADVHVRD